MEEKTNLIAELANDEQIDLATKELNEAIKAINSLKRESEVNRIAMIAARDRFRRANETVRNLKVDY